MIKKPFWEYFKQNKALYFMILPGLLVLIVFKYLPMYGIIISFENFYPTKGVLNSEWVGLKHFQTFFRDPYSFRIIRNTLVLGVYSLLFSFPAPIILALLLNEVKNQKFKKLTQTISYMPYFLSVVIVVGLLKDMLSMNDGVINDLLVAMGLSKINFFIDPDWFRTLYISSGIWQGIGFSSIIYLAAIAGINPELYEAAILDGANRFKQAKYITIPSILPTIVILFILAVGGILGSDFQKIILMYHPMTYETADVISTYVYRQGILGASFSYSTAVGLLTSIISLIFITTTNYISKKVGETSLW